MSLMKSSSSPDLSLKSAARDHSFLQSSSYKEKYSKSEDGETTSCSGARSFEFREDPSFWKDHNVQVIIRVRPLSSSEISLQGQNRCVQQESSQSITWTGHPETRFTFDLVADESVSQEMLFKVAGVPMVENCMEGYNSCMFAYGQTGSGKTHTMLGDIEGGARRHSVNCGMTPRVFEYLFSRIQKEKDARREEKLKFTCKCSFLEIYNEQILDLLDTSAANLQIREDTKKGVYVESLTEVEVLSARDVIQQLIQGAANRKVAATNMNRASSRSHSVFTCIIESKWESQGVTCHRFARLNLVDLAGSERQKSSGAEGERLKEATNINKSLSTLGLVIMNLVNISNGKSLHVPYRDSKLTFLLQDSLGGNAKTIIIANISPSSCCSLESLSTLKFAQRAKFIKNHAIINEDASGDVLALKLENQNLKKEISRLRSLVNGEAESYETDVLSVSFPGSPGNFKWDGLQGFTSPLMSEKKMSHIKKKEYEVALIGAFRREKDKDAALQALAAENQAALQLAKEREGEIQGLKMRLRFREAGLKRLEAVASGKISAEIHLLKEKEEHLKEIEVLRAQVDRNQEVTRFAMENLRLKEEIRRLKSFCEEGERERMNEQILILQNKLSDIFILLKATALLTAKPEEVLKIEELLEALDWKLMNESDPAVTQNESLELLKDAPSNSLSPNQKSASSWQISMNEENEFLRLQAIHNQSELELLRKKLELCLEEKANLERHVNDLTKELEVERSSKEATAKLAQIGQSDQMELKTMVDAIAAASDREAEAHEMAVFLSRENDELRMKLKILIEDNNKLIDLYERAVADKKEKLDDDSLNNVQDATEDHAHCLTKVADNREHEMKEELESLKRQLMEMHEENDKLLTLYEKAMQEKDEFKRVIASGQREIVDNRGEFNSLEKPVEVDDGQCLQLAEPNVPIDKELHCEEVGSVGSKSQNHETDMEIDGFTDQEEQDEAIKSIKQTGNSKSEAFYESTVPPQDNNTIPTKTMNFKIQEYLSSAKNKLLEVQENISYSAHAISMFGPLERIILEVDDLSERIGQQQSAIQAKEEEATNLKSISSGLQQRIELANKKFLAIKHSLTSLCSSIHYFDQREARASSRLDGSLQHLMRKQEKLIRLQVSRVVINDAFLRIKQAETDLRNCLEDLRSKVEENKKLEGDRVLFAIDNVEMTDSSLPHRNWQMSGKATELLKSEEEKTKLQNRIKLNKEQLVNVRKEVEAVNKKLSKLDCEIQALGMELQKEMLSVDDMDRKFHGIVEEKAMLLEMRENGRKELESMIVEYYQSLFEAELKEEEMKIMDEEMVTERQELEVLKRAKVEANNRKRQLMEAISCDSSFASDKVESDLHNIQKSVVELNCVLEKCCSIY